MSHENHDVASRKNIEAGVEEIAKQFREIQRLFGLLLASKRLVIRPNNIKSVLPKEFQNYFQHDAIEFGRFFMEAVSRCVGHIF
jgi:hypothetical protein